MAGQKTYWHLLSLKHKPTEYDIATSRLLYHPTRGFEVDVPVADWYRTHQAGSRFQCSDWERFVDPRETTYSRYTALQARREIFVDGLLATAGETGHDARLTAEWLRTLGQVLSPLRYPVHGLQMAAAYVGQMAPAGRIAICALLQTADEVRRIQRLAYRLAELRETHRGLGGDGRAAWESDPAWQPLREAIEHLLVTWDWGEAFVALNFAIKPAFDELFMVALGRMAQVSGDDVLQKMLLSLNEDCRWHRDWSQALVRTALADRAENREVLAEWLGRWKPVAIAALKGFTRVFEPFGTRPRATPFPEVIGQIEALLELHWQTAAAPGGPRSARTA